MDIRHADLLHARAEFHLCLARAFLPPRDVTFVTAMHDALADDLQELADTLGWDLEAPLADLRTRLGALPDAQALLAVYSGLFLVPPVAAHLNSGWYLDGAVDGGSVKALEQAYAACGLARDEHFRDLADHVSVQLEFVAFLFAAQARSFEGSGGAPPLEPGRVLHDHLLGWTARFVSDLEHAEGRLAGHPYAPLARMLAIAVAADAIAPAPDPRAARRRHAIESARVRQAARGITDEDLAEIRQKLQARGLSTAHLDPAATPAVSPLGPRLGI